MRHLLTTGLIFISILTYPQKKKITNNFQAWEKAVVNIETESYQYNKHLQDSIYQSKVDSGYSIFKLDSIKKLLEVTQIGTGTAVYIKYNDRKYLVTAKHVISDEILVNQKRYENLKGINHWDKLEAIPPRISIRTPFEYFSISKGVNNFAVFYNNFVKSISPYFFISDSTGDGIGVISLQEKTYKLLDTIMQMNGYSPISIKDFISNENLNVLDEIYCIGFPEMVSIVGRAIVSEPLNQLSDVVKPFIVKGSIAMHEPKIEHYYVDLTITPGNSGSPIIKNGKLVGIVSGINKYRIINEGNLSKENFNLFGIGHLVNIINVSQLIDCLDKYQIEENKLILLK